jgi:hypothetical protein
LSPCYLFLTLPYHLFSLPHSPLSLFYSVSHPHSPLSPFSLLLLFQSEYPLLQEVDMNEKARSPKRSPKLSVSSFVFESDDES